MKLAPKPLVTRQCYVALLLMAGMGLGLTAEHQPTIIGKVKKFTVVPEFHAAPHQSQMKSFLQGAEAEPLDGGKRVLIKSALLQTFRSDGAGEMVVEAPECTYDTATREVSSPGPLKAQTSDRRFSIEGMGFRWERTNSSLVISNQVRTFIAPELLRQETIEPSATTQPETGVQTPPPATPGSDGIRITSDSFTFLMESGLATYNGNVRALGTNLAMKSGLLSVEIPKQERRLETITAEREVVVDYAGVHATGQKVVYAANTGIARVYGQPAWEADQRKGRADEIMIDRTNRIFLATGNSWLQMPGQSLAPSGLMAGTGGKLSGKPIEGARKTNENPAQPQSPSVVEVMSHSYEFRTNRAVFRESVKVTERTPGQPPTLITSSIMTVSFRGSNQVDQLVVQDNVVISRPADDTNQLRMLSAERGVFDGTNGVLTLTGNPRWQDGERQGNGDVILVNSREESMTVRGHASMRMPAREFGQLTAVPGGRAQPSNKLPSGQPASRTSDFAELFAQEYTFGAGQARFQGGVNILHPSMTWASELLTVRLPEQGGAIDQIVAESGVVFQLVDSKGQKVHGKGAKAVYTLNVLNGRTNEFLELSGDPVLETTNGIFRNPTFIWDRANNKLIAPGNKYRLQGTAGTGQGTNRINLPSPESLFR